MQNLLIRSRAPSELARFYREAFGMTIKVADGDNWQQFSVGGANVSLAAESECPIGPQAVTPVFEVDSLATALTAFRAAGGHAGEIRDMGKHGRTAQVVDPEGHNLQLFERAGP